MDDKDKVFAKAKGTLVAIKAGQIILKEFRKAIGEEEYDKIMSEPVKSCKCGFIKQGNYTPCPKCEVTEESLLK
jgi:hypothetical protein